MNHATGFVVTRNGTPYLITNWHIVAGRDPITEQPIHASAGIPDSIAIMHRSKDDLRGIVATQEPLYCGGPLWLEHPLGRRVDVIALPLSRLPDGVRICSLEHDPLGDRIPMFPGYPVCIIGYPFGLSSSYAFPIWKTGHIANDPDLDYDDRPAFLIDATVREGMSGSPVVFRSDGTHTDGQGALTIDDRMITKFLGVYSGRLREDAEIGLVWRPHLIDEILNGQ